MATEISDLLTATAPQTVPIVRGITDEELDLPTPCAEYTVRDLLNHLFQVVINFQALADRRPADFSTTPDRLADGWRDRFAEETRRLIEAWSDPAALAGVSPVLGMPQPVVGGMVLLDLAVHGWDLARATGQRLTPEPAVVAELTTLAERLAPRARTMGVFGEAVTLPPEATDLDRLLALTGRDPEWTPATTRQG